MGILSRLEQKPPRAPRAYGFAAAEVNRLTASLATETDFINRVLRYQLRALRARSRQASQNNPFAARFAQLAVDNIAGPDPFRLQSKIRYNDGRFDDAANRRMEEAHASWCKRGSCEVTGMWSWKAMTRLKVRTLAVDGEYLFRKLRGPEWGPHGYQLQLVDADLLDETLNKRLEGGGAIHMGVELDAYGRRVAYHLLKRKPDRWELGYVREYERVPAEQVEHIFVPMFVDQVRGVPWIYAALLNLVHLGAFEEAAVVAARVGAAQMGIWQVPDGGGDALGEGKDAKGNPQINAADPGFFGFAPEGYQLASWNPKYPDAAIEPFVKAILRGTAAGLGVAYHNLANDPAEVNYSTAKVFGSEEHAMWMGLQEFVIDHDLAPTHRDWLRIQIMLGKLSFDLNRLDKYCEVKWQARRWASPDPLKDAKADVELIDNKLKSRTQSIAERGGDIEDTFDELAHENELAAAKKLKLDKPTPAAPGAAPKPGDDNEKPPQDDDGNDA